MSGSTTTAGVNSLQNGTYSTQTGDEYNWRPLAIALPVCLIGIPLVTFLILVAVCYWRKRSRGKLKFVQPFKVEVIEQGDLESNYIETSLESRGEAVSAANHQTYANLTETVREAEEQRKREEKKLPWKKEFWKGFQFSTENDSGYGKTDDLGERKTGDGKEDVSLTDERKLNGNGVGTGSDAHHGKGMAAMVVNRGFGMVDKNVSADGNHHLKEMNGQAVPLRMKGKDSDNKYSLFPEHSSENKESRVDKQDNRKTFVVMYPLDATDGGGSGSHMSLDVNDVLFFLDEEKDGWLKGEKKESGEVGWFPRSHVREGMSPLAKKHSTQKPEANETETRGEKKEENKNISKIDKRTSEQDYNYNNEAYEDFDDDDDYETGTEYQALYAYRAMEEGDISFDAGDIIVVVETLENGWWRGYHGDEEGFFPGSYVQPVNSTSPTEEHTKLIGDNDISGSDWFLDSRTEKQPNYRLTASQNLPVVAGDWEKVEVEALPQKKKNRKARGKTIIGDFFLSLPHRKMMTDGQLASTSSTSPDVKPSKTKKPVILPKVKKKKTQGVITKTRRNSIAPQPPPGTATSSALAKSIAQMVAQNAKQRRDHQELDVTYEELTPPPPLDPVIDIDVENAFQKLKSDKELDKTDGSGHITKNGSSDNDWYANLESSALLASGDKYSRTAQEQGTVSASDKYSRTEHSRTAQEQGTVCAPRTDDFSVLLNKKRQEVLKKPLPPKKPHFSGSTPDISAALAESSGNLRLFTVSPLREPQHPMKPKPLTAKPRIFSAKPFGGDGSEVSQNISLGSGSPLTKKFSRSLDNIAVIIGDGTSDYEDGEEPEIVNWLRRKLSEEPETKELQARTTKMEDARENEGKDEGRGSKDGDKETIQELHHKPNKELKIDADKTKADERVVLSLERRMKIVVDEESFV